MTDEGYIDCQLPIVFKGLISKKELSGKINQGGNLLTITTENGDITLKPI